MHAGCPAPVLLRWGQAEQQAVLLPAAPGQFGGILAVFRRERIDFSRAGIPQFHRPMAGKGNKVCFRFIRFAMHGCPAVDDEDTAAAAVFPQCADQVLRGAAALCADADLPQGQETFVQFHAIPGQALTASAEALRVITGQGIHIARDRSQENYPSAPIPEGLQRLKRCAAQCFASGHDDSGIGHFTDIEGIPRNKKIRQGGFTDIIKIKHVLKQPPGQFGKPAVQFRTRKAGPVVRAKQDPA